MATLYGETSGSLIDKQKGASQTLSGVADENNTVYGDAGVAITDSARGAGDILAGGDITGDTIRQPNPEALSFMQGLMKLSSLALRAP
jgi:hypothetical protein